MRRAVLFLPRAVCVLACLAIVAVAAVQLFWLRDQLPRR